MRSFEDRDGRRWDVVVGRESWGAIFAIFVPVGSAYAPDEGGPVIRQLQLRAKAYDEANRELGGASEEELREMLERSDPKSLE